MSVFHDIGRDAANSINVNRKSAMVKTALSPGLIARVLAKTTRGAGGMVTPRVSAIAQRLARRAAATGNASPRIQSIQKAFTGTNQLPGKATYDWFQQAAQRARAARRAGVNQNFRQWGTQQAPAVGSPTNPIMASIVPPQAAAGAAAPAAAAAGNNVGLGQMLGKGVDNMFSGGGSLLGKALKLPFSPGMPIERRLLTAGGLGVAGAGINDALSFAADKTGLPIPHIGEWDPSRVKGLAKQEPWTTGLMHPLQYLASKNAPDASPFRPAGPRGQLPSGLQFKNPTYDPTTGRWRATADGTIDMEASPEVQNAYRQHQEATEAFKRFGIPAPGQSAAAPAAPAPRATNPNMDHYRWSPPSMYAAQPRTLNSPILNAAY